MTQRGNGKRFRPLRLPSIRSEEVTPTPRFLTVREACKYGGFGHTKAYELIRTGKITAVRLGNRTLIITASIDKFHDTLPKLTLGDEA